MKLKNRIRKQVKPVVGLAMQLEQAYNKKKLVESDREQAANLINWRAIAHNWNDAQLELVKQILTRARELKRYSLYAITDGELVKLGLATNINRRMGKLQTGCGRQLGVIWQREVGLDRKYAYQLENDLHIRCRKHRVRGEWFNLACMSLVMEFRD